MTTFDYLVLLVIVCSVVIGTFRGLVREVLSLMSWIVAFMVANAYGEAFSQLLPDVFPGTLTRLLVGFVILFIGIRLLMGLLSMTVEVLVKASGLTTMDRGLGSLFGLGRGLLIVLTVVVLCGLTAIPRQPFWKEALLSPWAEAAALILKPYLPGDFAQRIEF